MARIRPMELRDAVAVADLTTQLGYPVDAAAQATRIADVLEDRQARALMVAVDEADVPIGWVHVERLRFLEGDATALVMGLVVDEGHRNDGAGAELLRAAEAWAVEHGSRRMQVRSRVTRERAHRFYERHGYARLKTSHVFQRELGE